MLARFGAIALLLLVLPTPSSAHRRPVVAVFDVEDRGAGLSRAMLERLGDFFAMRLAASGRFQVVPRAQMKERLVQQKKESFKQCYDQSCQIEVGRELAAQKSVSTLIAKLGSRCMVTAVLYDLKRATSEGGASQDGDCSEDGITASLGAIIGRLTVGAQPEARPVSAGGTPRVETVSVDLNSTPEGAEVFLADRAMGRTPTRLSLQRGRYALALQKRGYQDVRRDVVVSTLDKRFTYTLTLSDEGLRLLNSRNEWFALEPILAFSDKGLQGGGLAVSIVTLRWTRFFLKILEVGGGAGPSGHFVHIGPVVGFPISLGMRGRHQLKLGLGVEFVLVENGGPPSPLGEPNYEDKDGLKQAGLSFIPALSYHYQTAGRLYFGGTLRISLPVVGFTQHDWREDRYGAKTKYNYPFMVMLSFPMGWAQTL